jgi:hypothetical protein
VAFKCAERVIALSHRPGGDTVILREGEKIIVKKIVKVGNLVFS